MPGFLTLNFQSVKHRSNVKPQRTRKKNCELDSVLIAVDVVKNSHETNHRSLSAMVDAYASWYSFMMKRGRDRNKKRSDTDEHLSLSLLPLSLFLCFFTTPLNAISSEVHPLVQERPRSLGLSKAMIQGSTKAHLKVFTIPLKNKKNRNSLTN